MQKGKKYYFYFYISILITILIITIKTNEEVIENINAPEYNENKNHKESFSEEWEQKMSDYEPDFVYMIPIEYKSSETFYQKFNKIPFVLRGALLVDEEKNEKVELKIESPSGNIIYSDITGQLIFKFDLKETGIYKFHFDNRYVNSELRVTFTLNSGNNDVIKKADLDFSHQKANELLSVISKMKNERKIRQGQVHNRSLSKFSLNFTFFLY
jgi:hypothetical protein